MTVSAFLSSRLHKLAFMRRSFGDSPFRLLDVGAGNHSARKIKSVFPSCEYHGVDLNREYNNDPADFALMHRFYEMDLTKLDMSSIPDDYFDGIWMAHIIEHLYNGDQVILALLPKLKKGGYLYIEYPGARSTRLPSMKGTLNFHDDASHVRVYAVPELSALVEKAGCRVLRAGTRRNRWLMMAMPFKVLGSWLRGKSPEGNTFWDILGFAEFLWIKKS